MAVSPQNISVKLANFETAEIFKNDDFGYKLKASHSKQVDARCVDMVAVGKMLFQCMTTNRHSLEPVAVDEESDISMIYQVVECGHWCFHRNQKEIYLSQYNMFRIRRCDSFVLLKGLLTQRLTAFDAVQHPWFASFYKRFAVKLHQKHVNTVHDLQYQTAKMAYFPYFEMK